MTQWVDFKLVRQSVGFGQVLSDLGVRVTIKGDQATGFCPLPGHKARSKGASPSFSVNLKRGIFQCFGCHAKGNVLEFFTLMEGLDPSDAQQLRAAALRLQERYLAGDVERDGARVSEKDAAAADAPVEEDDSRPRIINAPLDFTLQSLDPSHPYFKRRGLTPETVARFGLGYCKRGLMKGRAVIPLHDHEGRLIGYAGRLVDDKAINDEEPKYRLPGKREREGVVHEFRKSEFLFNGHRFAETVDDLVVVEGFFGAMWLHQQGFSNVVALMGSSISEAQSNLILDILALDGTVWAMPDGDEAGEKCAHAVFEAVASQRAVRWVRLPDGKQPEDLDADGLGPLLDPWTQQ